MGSLLVLTLLAVLAYMTVWWLIAVVRKRLDTVDTAWASGFLLLALLAFWYSGSWSSGTILVLVLIWAFRLTLHLVRRSAKRKEDPRYETLSRRWGKHFWLRAYFSIFLVQGILVWLIGLPVVLATTAPYHQVWLWASLGVIVWAIGFIIERRADAELAAFTAQSSNKGKVLDSGLWRYSRHPNYFGEISQWFGIGIGACAASWGWVGLLGPIVLLVTIVFVSGIPPIERRHAKDPAWQAYKRRTSVLVPLPPRS